MLDEIDGLCILEHGDMAKKKSTTSGPKQVMMVAYKADSQTATEYKIWLEELAEHTGAPITVMIDMALKLWAQKQKFRPPPRRLVR